MKTKFTLHIVLLICVSVFGNLYAGIQPPKKNKFIVVLDAGHGGKDPGKPSKAGYLEKDIALKITLAIGKELEKRDDIKVIYTRKTDVFVELVERGAIANRADADLFVSVHCNAHNSQASGVETYVLGLHRNKTNFEVAKAENAVIFLEDNYEERYEQYDINSPESFIGLTLMQEEFLNQSIYLASLIQDNFRDKLKRKDRSVKQAGFIVLHQTVMPSVLVETGFITNNEEGKYLASSKGQSELAGAISSAVVAYKTNVDLASYVDVNEELPKASPTKDVIFDNVLFKVQIAASSRKLDPKPYNFNGLKDLSREKSGSLYKYFYGSTSNYTQIQNMLKEAKAKGYNTAFVVSFKNGIQVPVKEVLN